MLHSTEVKVFMSIERCSSLSEIYISDYFSSKDVEISIIFNMRTLKHFDATLRGLSYQCQHVIIYLFEYYNWESERDDCYL